MTVAAVIADVGPDTHTQESHQHIYVKIGQVLDNPEHVSLAVGDRVHVAIHYGDSLGIPAAIPGLQPGRSIEVRGRFVSQSQAYPAPSGEQLAVIHFTHHPIGYVLYAGVRYA